MSIAIRSDYQKDGRAGAEIWEHRLTNINTLLEIGFLTVNDHVGFLNERPEVFNAIVGYNLASHIEMHLGAKASDFASREAVASR